MHLFLRLFLFSAFSILRFMDFLVVVFSPVLANFFLHCLYVWILHLNMIRKFLLSFVSFLLLLFLCVCLFFFIIRYAIMISQLALHKHGWPIILEIDTQMQLKMWATNFSIVSRNCNSANVTLHIQYTNRHRTEVHTRQNREKEKEICDTDRWTCKNNNTENKTKNWTQNQWSGNFSIFKDSSGKAELSYCSVYTVYRYRHRKLHENTVVRRTIVVSFDSLLTDIDISIE